MHDADIIELSSESSSPPPEPVPPKRHATRSKGKGKMKEPEVIELTDDSDLEIQLLDVGPPKHGSKGLKTAFSKLSRRKNRGKQKAVVDDNSDIDIADIAAPAPPPAAGPSRVRDDLMSNYLKEHPSSNFPVGSSRVVPGGVNQLRADSQVESDTGAEVTQVVNKGLTLNGNGKNRASNFDVFQEDLNLEDGVDFVDFNNFNPPLSPSPTASPAHIDPGPSILAIPGSSAKDLVTTYTGMVPSTPPPPVPLPPPPLLESPEESMSRYVAQVLEIVPDVEPEHCASLVADHQHLNEGTVERILHILFEDPNYPRVQKGNGGDKGKRKVDGDGEGGSEPPNKKAKGNGKGKAGSGDDDLWLNVERPFVGGINYYEIALSTLQQNFPFTPKNYLRDRLTFHKGFYAPTFFFLRKLTRQIQNNEIARQDYPYEPRKTAFRPPAKGKQRVLEDREFDIELAWVKKAVDIEEGRVAPDQNAGDGGADDDEADDDSVDDEANEAESGGEDEENGIECGCCFTKYRFEKMIQCPDAHLFCVSCLRSYASTLLGSHNPNITCMSQSQCTGSFPASQLARVLPRKTYALYERLIQAKEIDAAGLEGLEECPFCEWKCVMEVGFEGEKLFRCGNDIGGCGVVSCRKCKKLDHLPKSCQEVEDDKKLNAQHLVEEAMTQALMRNCPNCKKAFIKESGCNKMTCPNCRTLSCYICRQVITGYEHFDQNRNRTAASSSSKTKKCILWDKDLDAFHANEVKLAADQAMAEVRMLHPQISTTDLKVDVPSSSKRKATANPNDFFEAMGLNGVRAVANQRGGGRGARRGVPLARRRRIPGPGNGNDRMLRNLFEQIPAPPPPPPPAQQMPNVHVHVHQHQHGPPGLAPQHHRPLPFRPVPPGPAPFAQVPIPQQQQQPGIQFQFLPQVPPAPVPPPVPAAPQLDYHQQIAQAMLGQYQPAQGHVEVGGRMLRARPARVDLPIVNLPVQGVGAAGDMVEGMRRQEVARMVNHYRRRQNQVRVEQHHLQFMQRQQEEQRQMVLQEVQRQRQIQARRNMALMLELGNGPQVDGLGGMAVGQQRNVEVGQRMGQVMDRVEVQRWPPEPEPQYQVGQKRKRGRGG